MRNHAANIIATNFISWSLPLIFTLLERNSFDPFKTTRRTSASNTLSRNIIIRIFSGIGKSRSHNFRICTTNICHICCFLRLLQLAGENRDRDGGQDGDDRNDDQEFCEGKAFFVVLLQVLILL